MHYPWSIHGVSIGKLWEYPIVNFKRFKLFKKQEGRKKILKHFLNLDRKYKNGIFY